MRVSIGAEVNDRGGRKKARGGAIGVVPATVNVDLTLTWTSGTTVLTPIFTLDGAILPTDRIVLSIYSNVGLTTLVDSDENTVDPSEEGELTLAFPGIGALSPDEYWSVATLAGTNRIGTSNTVTKTLVDP
jgi:hypothetical protein